MTSSTKALAALLTADNILLDLDVANKTQLFDALGPLLQSQPALAHLPLPDCLKAREQLGSTAIGAGVAVPHSRVRGLEQALALYIRPRTPIPFDAPDGKLVAHIVVIFVPEQATHAHLQLLAGVAELFQDSRVKDELRACIDANSVARLFTEWSA
jgi:PTS system nitrogen regulatory IIA component